MKKKLLCVCLCLCVLTACGAPSAGPGKPRIVATIFPLYDWTRQVLGPRADTVDLTLLLDNGTDMHSYQPTVDDMVRISNADLLIYVGGESDQWIADALEEASNSGIRALNLMEILGDALREETLLPGMEPEAVEETAYDEHIWLSPRNAATCCQAIADALEDMDIVGRDESGADGYRDQLLELHDRYLNAVRAAPLDTVLFADRFPFRYLADDYGLRVYAAFQGCSAETEASFDTIAFLAAKLDELALPAVLTTESADGKLAQTIVRTSQRPDTPVWSMDSMQSGTAPGADYLSVMEGNLDVLRRALGA